VLTQASRPEALLNGELLHELFADASLLIKRQIRLAQLEARRQLHREKSAVEWLGSGGLIAYAGVILLLVAAAAAIGDALGGRVWLGAIIVGCALIAIAAAAGLIGFAKRVREALPRTRRELNKEITWARTQVTT